MSPSLVPGGEGDDVSREAAAGVEGEEGGGGEVMREEVGVPQEEEQRAERTPTPLSQPPECLESREVSPNGFF